MPQFDFHSFSVQVFWTLIGFSLYYFPILNLFLKRIVSVLKIRQFLLKLTANIKSLNLYSLTLY